MAYYIVSKKLSYCDPLAHRITQEGKFASQICYAFYCGSSTWVTGARLQEHCLADSEVFHLCLVLAATESSWNEYAGASTLILQSLFHIWLVSMAASALAISTLGSASSTELSMSQYSLDPEKERPFLEHKAHSNAGEVFVLK